MENDGGDGVVTFVPSRVDTVSSLENLQWGRSLPLLIISIAIPSHYWIIMKQCVKGAEEDSPFT